MIPQEIKDMINVAIADGEIEEQEKNVILQKAMSIGCNMPDVKMYMEVCEREFFLSQKINEILYDITNHFIDNELAYLTLQGKNELQIRDKFAWLLQCELDNKYGEGIYIVRKEWSKKGRSKVDVAILKVSANKRDYDEVVTIIEFKAQECLLVEPWIFGNRGFRGDVAKLQSLKSNQNINNKLINTQFYFVLLISAQNKKPADYDFAISYVPQMNSSKCGVYPMCATYSYNDINHRNTENR